MRAAPKSVHAAWRNDFTVIGWLLPSLTVVHSPHMPARSIVVIAVPINLDGHFIDERTPTSDIPHTDYALRNACNDRI
ncbi:hypothetical protein A4A58_19070 [Tardiphaga robiniae]|uniref:Uncharacterized protein n=1 Tax=Tardiphaga robiniae TaxID=943830 RepID=A0A163X319_9BRAD|nr:hypothetical protein A4A58_19070 [Tardiphaga robiniae]